MNSRRRELFMGYFTRSILALVAGVALLLPVTEMLAAGRSDAVAQTLGSGETIVVNTTDDVVAFSGPQTVADPPGPDGKVSFREAVIASNNTPGPQTIAFAIPQSDWWLLTELALLRLENGPFIITDNETTVDFLTQTSF